LFEDRPCFEDVISRTGSPSPLGSYCVEDEADFTECTTNADCTTGACVADSSRPQTVALFCIPPTASASINAAGGIPGPGAITFNSAVIVCRCGDGEIGCGEECDDGNDVAGDGCDDGCRLEP
jgi:cysteine-rich repeat protein